MQTNFLLRFDEKIDRGDGDGCWVWTAGKTPGGYGQFRLSKSQKVYAHRLAYELWHGPIPEGHEIDHLCFNRACVRPEHLEAVTPAENHRRRRGRPYRPRHPGEFCQHGHPRAEFMALDTYGRHVCLACRRLESRRRRAALNRR